MVVSLPPNLMMSVFYRKGCLLAISRVVVLEDLALVVVSPRPNLKKSVFYQIGCLLAIFRVVVLEYLAL